MWPAFTVFGISAAVVIGGWVWANHSTLVDDTPAAFRKVLELNGTLWHKLSGHSLSVSHRPIPIGKKPRVNGDAGLSEPVDLATWKMDLEPEAGSKPLEVRMDQIRALPRSETTAQFRCIEGWSDDIAYAGVKFSDFLAYYHIGNHSGLGGAPYRYVGLETPDGEYYVSIDMESMLHPQTMLAYEMNGAPLDSQNGAPLRLIIPIKYGIKSIKRIGRIFFSDTRPPDYWAEQGYDWFAGL
jgi:DMSO/TMAO reductase YedYZ molybdopterin-dependent catalytic subunit